MNEKIKSNGLGVKAYHTNFRRVLPPFLIALMFILAVVTITIGAYSVKLGNVIEVVLHNLFGYTTLAPNVEKVVVWQIRFPRMLGAAVVGAALASSGAVMQGMFRNPLADPGLIGVSAGASLMAALAIVMGNVWFGQAESILGFWLIPIFAFVGGTVVTFFIYFVALTPRGVSVVTMLLAGIAINAVVGSISGTLTYVSNDQQLRDIAFWTMGSLGGVSWKYMALVGALALVCFYNLSLARGLNANLLGEAEARHIGIDTAKFNRKCVVLTALSVGFSVSIAGPIAFVGIVVPHILRLMTGPDHRFLLPNSMILGAVMVLLSDILARTMFPPAEIPIGIITSAIGAPFFLYILMTNKRHIN